MGIWSIWRSLDPFHQMSTGRWCHLHTNLFKISNQSRIIKALQPMINVNICTDTKLTAVIGRHIKWGAVGVPLARVFGDGCLAISSRLWWWWAVASRRRTFWGWMQTEEERIEDTWWSIFQLTLWVINLIKRQQQNWNCIRLVFCAVHHFWQIRQIIYLPMWSRRRHIGRKTKREIVGAFLAAAVRLEWKKKNDLNEKEFGWQRKMTAESNWSALPQTEHETSCKHI